MKYFALTLFATLSLTLAGMANAEKAKAINCGTWPATNDIKCADKGGTISCIEGSSSPLCCKTGKDGKKVCTNNPDLLERVTAGAAKPTGSNAGVNKNGGAGPSTNTTIKQGTFNKNAAPANNSK
jgi:hypothetical protein